MKLVKEKVSDRIWNQAFNKVRDQVSHQAAGQVEDQVSHQVSQVDDGWDKIRTEVRYQARRKIDYGRTG